MSLHDSIQYAIGAIPMKCALALLSCVVVFGCGAGGAPESTGPGARGRARPHHAAAEPETERPSPAKPRFRKELFAKAHRAAIEFSSGGKVQLATELELIEGAIRTDEERAVFTLFETVENVQTDMNALWAAKQVTEEAAKGFARLAPHAKSLMRDGMPLTYKEVSAMDAISRSGGVAVSTMITFPKLEQAMRPLVSRHSLTPKDHDGVQWVPYEATRSQLKAAERAALKTMGEMIHNEGRPR